MPVRSCAENPPPGVGRYAFAAARVDVPDSGVFRIHFFADALFPLKQYHLFVCSTRVRLEKNNCFVYSESKVSAGGRGFSAGM